MENSAQQPIALEAFYAYGYQGRSMIAVRAPFATREAGRDLVGRNVMIDGAVYLVLGVYRQISGAITAGEPVGLEVRALADRPAA